MKPKFRIGQKYKVKSKSNGILSHGFPIDSVVTGVRWYSNLRGEIVCTGNIAGQSTEQIVPLTCLEEVTE